MKIPSPHYGRALPVFVKPFSMRELSEIYGVGIKTLRKWLAPFEGEIGPRQGRYFTVAQVQVIFRRLGVPGALQD